MNIPYSRVIFLGQLQDIGSKIKFGTWYDRTQINKVPEKTFIGRIQKRFDFLGYHFDGLHLRPAKITIERAIAKITLLYEEKASANHGGRLADYARRWCNWVRAGVPLAPGAVNKNSDIWSKLGVDNNLQPGNFIPQGMDVPL